VTTRSERGQASVELALLLPVVVIIAWGFLEGILLARDQVLLSHAAREAARVYSVDQSVERAANAARDRSSLGEGLQVRIITESNGVARITVALDEHSRLPLIGRIASDLLLTADVAMMIESDPDAP
jgi:Flp pilus assembly protein TadG